MGGTFLLYGNQSLTNVDGLSKLRSVGRNFFLYQTPALKDISGISNLTSFDKIYLDNEYSNNSNYQNTFDVKLANNSDICDSNSIYYYSSGWRQLPLNKYSSVCQ